MTHSYEDISDRTTAERKTIARDRWKSIPTVIRDIFANAPTLAMYEALRPPCLVNARGIQVPSDSSKGGIKLLRIFQIRKTTPQGDAVFCR
jgi:hypothetical protein